MPGFDSITSVVAAESDWSGNCGDFCFIQVCFFDFLSLWARCFDESLVVSEEDWPRVKPLEMSRRCETFFSVLRVTMSLNKHRLRRWILRMALRRRLDFAGFGALTRPRLSWYEVWFDTLRKTVFLLVAASRAFSQRSVWIASALKTLSLSLIWLKTSACPSLDFFS